MATKTVFEHVPKEPSDESVQWVLEGTTEDQADQLVALLRVADDEELRRYKQYARQVRIRRSRQRRVLFGLLLAVYSLAALAFAGLALLALFGDGSQIQVVVASIGAAIVGLSGTAYAYITHRLIERRRERQAELTRVARAWKSSSARSLEAH